MFRRSDDEERHKNRYVTARPRSSERSEKFKTFLSVVSVGRKTEEIDESGEMEHEIVKPLRGGCGKWFFVERNGRRETG